MKKHDREVLTFTKKWVNRLMWCFIIWISLSYILAFLGMGDVLETLSTKVVITCVAVFLGYMLKAFFETYSEENLKYKREVNTKTVEEGEDYGETETEALE